MSPGHAGQRHLAQHTHRISGCHHQPAHFSDGHLYTALKTTSQVQSQVQKGESCPEKASAPSTTPAFPAQTATRPPMHSIFLSSNLITGQQPNVWAMTNDLPYFTDYMAILFSSTSTHAPYNTVRQMYG